VKFDGEYNGGPGKWTQLKFTISNPKIGPFSIPGKKFISFTLDGALSGFLRTDLRFRNDWLKTSYFLSSKKNEMYIGSRPLNREQKRDLLSLSAEEKVVAAWIISNSDELIQFALKSKKYLPPDSQKKWLELSKGDLFEKNIRANLGPHLKSQIAEYDNYSKHTKFALERQIQPNLQKLGLYSGKVDGLWGNQTKNAIMKFEALNGLFPDGVNYGAERTLLSTKARERDLYTDIVKVKEREAANKSELLELTKKLSVANNEIERLKNNIEIQKRIANQYKERLDKAEKSSASVSELNKLNKDLEFATKTLKEQSSLANTRLAQINDYKNRISKLNSEAVSAADTIRELKEKLKNANLNKDLNDKLKEISKTSSERLARIVDLQRQLAITKKLSEEQNISIDELNKEILALKKSSVSIDELNLVTDLSTNRLNKIVDLEKQLAQSSQIVKDRNYTVEKLESDILQLRKLSVSRDVHDNLVSELSALRVSLNDLKVSSANKISVLENENRDLQDKIAKLESETTGQPILPAFELSEEWQNVERYLAVQQVRFCQILNNYTFEAKAAEESKNQLRQNLVATNRDNDIAALLPNGNYKDWVVKVVEVYATPNGDAAFVLRLPCDVTFGSGQLTVEGDLDGSYAATAEFGGIIYNQLAQLSQGDTVLISGNILTYEDIGALNKRLKFVTTLNGNKTSQTKPGKSKSAPDYFSKINYLSKL